MSGGIRKARRGWKDMGLQGKLVSIFALTLFIIFVVNLVMFVNINVVVNSLERVYVSNLNLDGLRRSLGEVQDSMTEYLNTKSSDSLDRYYRAEQTLRDYLQMLNTDASDDEMLIAEKNIYHLSVSYLNTVDDTINAKRGRDVEQYSAGYEKAAASFSVIETFIYSLNNMRFRSNNNDYNRLLRSLRYMDMIHIGVLVIASILNILLMSLFTGSIIRPLRRLSVAAGEVSKGDFDVTVEQTDTQDEIGILSKTFAQMLDSIRQYLSRLRESLRKENEMKERELMMESRVKDAQLRYLQAQINPHFLFNTLNAGAQLAMMEGADKTADFIDHMAGFFRYNISRQGDDSTIGEELQTVDNYIYILNVRFAGEIHYRNTVDESMYSARVPGMILQPVVENAVNYGIRDLEGEKIIEVSCSRVKPGGGEGSGADDGEYLELSVWDNGKGMTGERIDEILGGRYVSEHNKGNGIGLGNVMERMELFFGKKSLLDIRSDGEGTGTEVVLRVPVDAAEDDAVYEQAFAEKEEAADTQEEIRDVQDNAG